MCIHLPVDGHLGYFRLFAIVNPAVVNVCVQVLFVSIPILVILGTDLGVELLGHMVILFKLPRDCQIALRASNWLFQLLAQVFARAVTFGSDVCMAGSPPSTWAQLEGYLLSHDNSP